MKQFFSEQKKSGERKKEARLNSWSFGSSLERNFFFGFSVFFSFPRDSLEGQNVSPTFSGEEIKLKKLKEKKKKKKRKVLIEQPLAFFFSSRKSLSRDFSISIRLNLRLRDLWLKRRRRRRRRNALGARVSTKKLDLIDPKVHKFTIRAQFRYKKPYFSYRGPISGKRPSSLSCKRPNRASKGTAELQKALFKPQRPGSSPPKD